MTNESIVLRKQFHYAELTTGEYAHPAVDRGETLSQPFQYVLCSRSVISQDPAHVPVSHHGKSWFYCITSICPRAVGNCGNVFISGVLIPHNSSRTGADPGLRSVSCGITHEPHYLCGRYLAPTLLIFDGGVSSSRETLPMFTCLPHGQPRLCWQPL